MNFLELDRKVILIAGATVGIGRQTAIDLSRQHARLILIARNESALVELLNELEGEGHLFFPFDFSRIDQIDNLVKEVVAKAGKLDGYVNCIGMRSRRPINLLKPDILQEVMTLNFNSFIETVRCITRKGNFNEGFSIVGVSSISALAGGMSVTAYAASKAAMDAAVRCLAKELAPKKIRLNTVVPAQINTPAFDQLSNMNETGNEPLSSRQFLGLGQPEDVSSAILFLLSERAKFITGTAIPVDGGYLAT